MVNPSKRRLPVRHPEENAQAESTAEKPSYNQQACTLEALHEVRVLPTEVIVTVDLPMTEESSLQVKPADKNTLDVSARMKRKVTLREMGVTHHKGEFEKLHCHLQLPVPVKMDKIDLHIKKGMLQIHIPRNNQEGSTEP